MRRVLRALAIFVMGAGFFSYVHAAVAQSPPDAPDADAQADSLLKRMTLEEKISLLGGEADQFSTHAIPRLGIRKLYLDDGPQGVRDNDRYGPACSFPCGAALAATWDVQLAAEYGQAMGLEARARGIHITLGPGANICRVPVNGRNFEYFGEDPFLAGKIAAGSIRAMQAQGVVATIKHFAMNNQELNRNSVDVQVDERTMQEIYLPAFHRAVQEGGVGAVMASYNRVNGDYAAENDVLLNQILKQQWRFKGIVMSDWGACHSTEALDKGLDLEMGTANFFKTEKVSQALAAGAVKQEDIDQAVHRILRTAIAMGFFDRVQKRSDLPLNSRESDQAALDVARSAIVLLKNQGNVLPLDRSSVHRIAVYGPNAFLTPAGGGGSGSVTPFHSVSFLGGIRGIAGPEAVVTYVGPAEVDPEIFAEFKFARTAADGEPGLTMTIKPKGDARVAPPSVQRSVELQESPGTRPPYGIVSGQGADCTWEGVLDAPTDGDWELVVDGRAKVTIGDQAREGGSIIHLAKDTAVPIKIELEYPAKYKKAGTRRVGLRPQVIADLGPARNADVAIVCAGLNSHMESEGSDRGFELPDVQQQLISAVSAANPKTIVVLNSGAALGMEKWIDSTPVVLQAWYLGQEGGAALGETLFGDVDPSGRLPSTFDRRFEDNPAFANYPGTGPADHPVENYAEGIFVGYRGYDKSGKDPQFPFGFGLSYTTFKFSNMKLEPAGDGINVSVDVTNTGRRSGAEVVQIYVGQPKCSVERPLRELKGFTKVKLDPDQTHRVMVPLPRDSFAYWSPAIKDWTVEPGTFIIEAGESERDIQCKASIEIK